MMCSNMPGRSSTKMDAIIANDVSREDSGFDSDNNQVYLITAEDVEEFPLLAKSQLARILVEKLARRMGP